MRTSEVIIKSNAQKGMVSYGFRHRFFLLLILGFWHKLRKSVAKVTENPTNPGEPTQLEWNQEIMRAHMWSIHPIDN